MIPILYEDNEKNYTTNGIGRLSDAVSCIVTEARNGEYVLDMEYPISGKLYPELKVERIIFVKANDISEAQPFSIYKISKPINGIVTVYAQHISYLLNKMIVMPFEADTCQEALSMIPANAKGGTTFTFWTNKSVTARFSNKEPRSARGLLGGEQGSILDVYGKGEYEFDRWTVRLHVNRGQDRGVALRYGKNITDLENTLDMSNVYTGIVPFWKTEDEIVLLPESVVWSNYTGLYEYNLVKAVDFSGEWQDPPTIEQLRTRAQKYVTDNEGWVLPQNITVSFVNLADTEEYKDIAPLEQVALCDLVTITNTPLGVDIKAQVVKTVYSVLDERYQSIELGETRPNLKTVIEEQVKEPIIQATSTRMQQAIKYATDLITGVKGGYLVINTDDNKTPTELLIMNTPDKNTATQVLRINMNGIGFGKSYNGPFNTAWTLDGHFVADYIDTGTLKADLIRTGILRALNNSRNYWNMLTGEFHLRSDNASTGIDYQNGVLNINASNIRSGTLDASVANITNINADNITAGTLDADLIKAGVLSDQSGNLTWDLETGKLVAKEFFLDTPQLWLSSDGYMTTTHIDVTGSGGLMDSMIRISDGNIMNGKSMGLYTQGITFNSLLPSAGSVGLKYEGGKIKIASDSGFEFRVKDSYAGDRAVLEFDGNSWDFKNHRIANAFFGGTSGTMNFVKVNAVTSDGYVDNWTNGCSLTFSNGILVDATW